MQQLVLEALWGLLTCNMSLALTFVFATSHVKVLNLDVALDCQMSFAEEKGVGAEKLDKVERKNFIMDIAEEDKDQAFILGIDSITSIL